MVQHASSVTAAGPDSLAANRWLWVMAVLPGIGFLAKQYLAIWAAAYVLYLWLDGSLGFSRLVKFATGAFGSVALVIGICLAVWGVNFRYWVFQVMGSTVISFTHLTDRLAESGWHIGLGVVGGLLVLRGANARQLLAMVSSWFVLFIGASYTSGITFHSSHFGPCTQVGFCLLLAGLATLWPDAEAASESRALAWFQLGALCFAVVLGFAGLRLARGRPHQVEGDLYRYTAQIEKEFEGRPADRVLLDNGEWIYLKKHLLMKDEFAILVTHRQREAYAPFLERVRRREYDRILVHVLIDGRYSYDIGPGRGIGSQILAHYREVRRIPHVIGMENWLYYTQSMSDIAVLEPIPAP
jgi:hypothetical protein